MTDESIINSCDYWDHRFATDWEANKGREQTAFFCRIAIDVFPPWLMDYLDNPGRSICDMGCALGEASQMLAEEFPKSTVVGVDFSEVAITCAKKVHNRPKFRVGNIFDYNEKHDVVFCSNTLEHFQDPQPIIDHLYGISNDYCLIAVPIWDNLEVDEHFYYFDESLFSSMLPKGARLAHGVIVDCRKIPNGQDIKLS